MSELKIKKLQALFYTDSDDKDKGDGIAETYFWGNARICENTGWARDIRFPTYRQHSGQLFEVDIHAAKCPQMRYQIIMETGDRWLVTVHVYAWYSDGAKRRVAAAGLGFGGKNRVNTIYFATCR